MDDLLLKEKGDEDRRDLLSKVKPIGHSVASEFVGLGSDAGNPVVVQRLEPKLRDDREAARLDGLMKGKTGEIHTKIIDSCLPLGQLKPFRDNHMSLMIHTGAKGSNVNLSQISCLLGVWRRETSHWFFSHLCCLFSTQANKNSRVAVSPAWSRARPCPRSGRTRQRPSRAVSSAAVSSLVSSPKSFSFTAWLAVRVSSIPPSRRVVLVISSAVSSR